MIDINKKYRTRSGLDVKIYDVINTDNQTAVFGAFYYDGKRWIQGRWDIKGCFFGVAEFNLIEVSPYADFKIDDKVIVWNNDGWKYKRHFAGISHDGLPMAFNSGESSWTKTSGEIKWSNCIKADENE